jgi:hypothetical protein
LAGVSFHFILLISFLRSHITIQNNYKHYPTLGRIALDILPIPASSVPCERLFSAAKEVADDRRARLGPMKFEELQVMKFAWRNNIPDLATWNSAFVEEVDQLDEFRGLLDCDNFQNKFDGLEHEGYFEDDTYFVDLD